jgi:hypothetical protein
MVILTIFFNFHEILKIFIFSKMPIFGTLSLWQPVLICISVLLDLLDPLSMQPILTRIRRKAKKRW